MKNELIVLFLLFVFVTGILALFCAWCHIWSLEGFRSVVIAERKAMMRNNDLISRSALYKFFDGGSGVARLHVADIDTLPAVDADPIVYAKWEHIGGDEWCCSNCGEVTTTEGSWEKPVYKRCYECGAHMHKKEEQK